MPLNCSFVEYPLDHCRKSVPLRLSGDRANTDPEILYTRVVSVSMGFNCKSLYSALWTFGIFTSAPDMRPGYILFLSGLPSFQFPLNWTS